MKTLLSILMTCMVASASGQIAKGIDEWLEQKRKANEEWKKYNQIIPYNAHYDTMNIGLPLPGTFPDPKALAVLKDSFRISNPHIPLKIQALALQKEQVDYKYKSSGVAVGYGMMPFAGNYWEDISLDYDFEATKKLLFNRLIRNRAAQTMLYQWAKPTMVAAFKSKPDTAQAIDMFAVWKAVQYLNQYDHVKEKKRAATDTFIYSDWRGKPDTDAKLYAFWYRRIEEFKKRSMGCSLEDARNWIKIAMQDMLANSTPGAKKLFSSWQKKWQAGQITNVQF